MVELAPGALSPPHHVASRAPKPKMIAVLMISESQPRRLPAPLSGGRTSIESLGGTDMG